MATADAITRLVLGEPERMVDLARFDGTFVEFREQVIRPLALEWAHQLVARHGSISAAARAAGMDRSNFKRVLRRGTDIRFGSTARSAA